MTRPVQPFRPQVDERVDRITLIDRYLGASDGARRMTWPDVSIEDGSTKIGIALVEATTESGIDATPGAVTIWHVLWVRDESRGSVTVSTSEGDHRWPVAPGDSVAVPPGASLRAAGGQLAVAITVPGTTTVPAPPTHGTEHFFGYNRQTLAFEVGGVRVCRWKLTQPLALVEYYPAPVAMMALARTSVIRTATTVDRLAQGQLAIVDPTANPIVTPDGLAYLLTIDRHLV